MPLIERLYNHFLHTATALQSLVLFALRLWIARVFFLSGRVKITDFDTTLALFRDEYKVPFLSPEFAAYSGTFFELACPVFLALGLATRAATLPLLAMTAVIQFTYDQNIQHAYWAMLLFTLLAFGGGRFSLDNGVARRQQKRHAFPSI